MVNFISDMVVLAFNINKILSHAYSFIVIGIVIKQVLTSSVPRSPQNRQSGGFLVEQRIEGFNYIPFNFDILVKKDRIEV